MTERIRAWLKGLMIALSAMALFAVVLGCFIALMLLVISMEEGGQNLSASTVNTTRVMILLSQGAGFENDTIRLTIVPLLLTMLLIALIWSLTSRICTDIRAYISGLALWEIMTVCISNGLDVGLVDVMLVILLKTAAVFTLGFAMAAVGQSNTFRRAMSFVTQHISAQVGRTIVIGTLLGFGMMLIYLLAGLITVLVWIALNHSSMAVLFAYDGMETGSRILTSIAMLAWLPNLCIWAMSWLFGAGFSIGELGSFTLWVGQSRSLPPLPVFGLLPQPVDNETIRFLVVLIPLAVGFLGGMIVMTLRHGFHVVLPKAADKEGRRSAILEMAYPAGGFCLSSVIISLLSSMLFALSNGSLGKERLASVGVDVMVSAQTVGRPSAMGLCVAWAVTLIGVALAFSIRWVRATKTRRMRTTRQSAQSKDSDRPARRTVASATMQTFHENNQQPSKEEHDEQHEPTDTPGSGIRLP